MLAEMASNLLILKRFSIIELMAGEMIHMIMLVEMVCNLLMLKWFSIIQLMVEEMIHMIMMGGCCSATRIKEDFSALEMQ